MLDPLQKRLLDIGSGLWDQSSVNRNYRGHASISLCTAGDDSIPGFCNTNHQDKKDWHKEMTDTCKARIKSEMENPKSVYEKERQKSIKCHSY